MITFKLKENLLILTYLPQDSWVFRKFDNREDVTLKKTFTFSNQDLLSSEINENDEEIEFILGRLEGEYFKIEPKILGINNNVFIHKNIKLSNKFFIATRNISIFRKISEIVSDDIYIGGEAPSTFPENEFARLIREFPNYYEINKYVDARLGSILGNYFDSVPDLQENYDRYMDKKPSIKGKDLIQDFKEFDLLKYEAALKKLEKMLQNEISYNEKQWQNEILEIILFLYPKYILVFKEVLVKDIYNKKDRKLDFLLVDANGNADLIEIKKPFGNKIITNGVYRDNYIPPRDLSGTVMQIEKYIFYLNKWGKKGEDALTKRYKAKLPKNLKIRITNPSGMIIMGRDDGLSMAQKSDFEVVKRKYKNVIDIITYDDLVRRLKTILDSIKRR